MLKSKVAVLGAGLALGSGAAMAAPAEFDWLAGHWCGGTEERRLDEVWLPEAGGALLGMSRTLSHGDMESFEYMRLVPAGKAAGLHVQPNGVAPTTFVIADHGANWVVFENPQNDFPKRISTGVMERHCRQAFPGREMMGRSCGFRLTIGAAGTEWARWPWGRSGIWPLRWLS